MEFISLKRVMDRLLRDIQDITYESVIDYTIDFISIVGMPEFFQSGYIEGRIENYRYKLPCKITDTDFVLINNQPAYIGSDAMQESFSKMYSSVNREEKEIRYIPERSRRTNRYTYKIEGNFLFSNIERGTVKIQYNSIRVNEMNEPLIPNERVFIIALENYIKFLYYQKKFRRGEIQKYIYDDVEQEYIWSVGRLNSKYKIPSEVEMETILQGLNTLRPSNNVLESRFSKLSSTTKNVKN